LVHAALALLPVLVFLVALLFLDSFKLVTWRGVLGALVAGGMMALGASVAQGRLAGVLDLDPLVLSRYWAPVVEEGLKAAYVFWLVRRGRVGFLVDAAIAGFAVGTGFALVENLEYLRLLSDRGLLLWIVRGFGTALLHGGATAVCAIVTKAVFDRHDGGPAARFAVLPGLVIAISLHSFFNHFLLPAVAQALLLMVGLPALMVLVFARSERATRRWLGVGLDTDLELLESIRSDSVLHTRAGAYLESLKARVPEAVAADMLRLMRTRLELGIQAKGALLAREAGLKIPVDADARDRLRELRGLEATVGPMGLLALKPILRRTSRDLWAIYWLERLGAEDASRIR
jgi:protease PrsW